MRVFNRQARRRLAKGKELSKEDWFRATAEHYRREGSGRYSAHRQKEFAEQVLLVLHEKLLREGRWWK